MRGLLNVIAIAAIAAGAPDKLDPRCGSLDSACVDVYLAIQCETIKDCIPRWQRLDTPLGNDTELCATCKKMVQEAQDELLSNITQESMREVLEGSCNVLIPIKIFRDMCKELMDVFQDELNDILVSRMNPSQVCTVSGLCWRSERNDLAERASFLFLEKSAQRRCSICTSAVKNFVQIFSYVPQDEILMAFSRVCQKGGFDEVKCNTFAQTYVAKFLHNVQFMPYERSCQFFRRCQGSNPPMPIAPVGGLECEFCEAMVHKVVAYLNNPEAKSATKMALKAACKLAGPYATECLAKINDDFDSTYDEIISLLDPIEVCTLARICGNNQVPDLRAPLMKSLVPATSTEIRSASQVTEHSICLDCMKIASYLVNVVNRNCSYEDIKAALEKVCEVIPMDVGRCQEYIDTHFDQLIEFLRSEITADRICKRIHLCGAHAAIPLTTSKLLGGPECQICSEMIGYLKDELKGNKEDTAIIDALPKSCERLSVHSAKCKETVRARQPTLIRMIQIDASTHILCSILNLCPERSPAAARRESSRCDNCEIFMNFVLAKVKDTKTDDATLDYLQTVCPYLHANVNECKVMIDVYGDMIVHLLKENASALEICAAVDLCLSSYNSQSNPTTLGLVPSKPKQTQMCAVCEIVVRVIEAELQNNRTRAEIETILEKACSALFERDRRLCFNMINVYTSYIIHMIENLMTPRQICQSFGFCAIAPTLRVCDVYNLVSGMMDDSQVNQDRDEIQIRRNLDRTCDLFPNIEQAMCQENIKRISNIVITLFSGRVPVTKICGKNELRLPSTEVAMGPKTLARVTNNACSLCKWLMTWIDDKLKDNRTESFIIEELDRACELFSDPGKCRDMVKDYLDMIVNMLVNYAGPEKICEAIKKCPNPQVRNDEPPCLYCKYVIGALRDELQKDEVTLKQKLDVICESLPIDAEQCQHFVRQYADRIINLILNNTEPEEICEVLSVCEKKISALSNKCGFCNEIMQFVTSHAKNEETDEEIVELLEGVCDRLPAINREDCLRLIEVDGSVIVRMVVENLKPGSICQAIHFCPRIRENSLACSWCQYAFHFIQEKLYENSTQQTIRLILDEMCSKLPKATIRADCIEFVDVYGASLDTIVAQRLDPSLICPAIHACPANRNNVVGVPRRSSSEKCHDCLSSLKFFRHNAEMICEGVKSEFAPNCVNATLIGVHMMNAFGSDYRICKFAKSCGYLGGYFDCNKGGCHYIH